MKNINIPRYGRHAAAGLTLALVAGCGGMTESGPTTMPSPAVSASAESPAELNAPYCGNPLTTKFIGLVGVRYTAPDGAFTDPAAEAKARETLQSTVSGIRTEAGTHNRPVDISVTVAAIGMSEVIYDQPVSDYAVRILQAETASIQSDLDASGNQAVEVSATRDTYYLDATGEAKYWDDANQGALALTVYAQEPCPVATEADVSSVPPSAPATGNFS